MGFHDAYARTTPFELAFPDREFAEERLSRLREAGEEGEVAGSLADPGQFLGHPRVAEILQEIRDPAADAEGLQKHGILLYHAFHFDGAGRPLYLLETHAARYLVESAGGGESAEPPPPPARSGYLQLPRQLFWTRPTEDGPPEPVDGIFWSAPEDERVAVLVAAGMRDDRPGFSAVPLPAVPLADAGEWLDAEIRPEGRDFESTLPGGEMERLYSLEAAGEVLKLLARTFRYLDRVPAAVRPEEPAPGEDPATEGEFGEAVERERGDAPHRDEVPDEAAGAGERSPRPSGLPYRRITLTADTDAE